MEEIKRPKGTKDMLPQDDYKWQYVENTFKAVANNYGMKEMNRYSLVIDILGRYI